MKKISILVLLASLLLVFSCRTENLLETESSNVNNQISKIQLTSKKISLNEAKHKEKLLSGIKDAEISLKAMAKGINNNGVYIDIDNLIYIENGPDYHTYTFNIIREGTGDDTPLENLVLSPLTDGTYREVLVTYNLSAKEKDILRAGGMVDFSKKMTFTPLQNNIFSKYTSGGQDCHMEIDSYYTKCSENVHDHGEQYPTCTAGKPSEIVYVIKEVCVPNNGGGESPYNPIDPYNPPGNDGGNGNNEGGDEYGGSSPCNGTGVLTGPQAPVSDPGFDQGGGCTGIPTQPNTALSFSSIIINLPAELKNTLDDNPDFKNGLETYYNINHKSVKAKNFVLWATMFKWGNPSTTWEQFQPMLTFAHNFLQENPDTTNPQQIFQRIKDLDDALIQNPNLLLNIPCSQLPEWQTLANHPIPTSIKNKISQINGMTGWFKDAIIQNLDYSNSFTINMDVYPVKIANMPEKSPGIKYTPAEFFDYFRKNINDFTDVNHGKFYPVVEPQYGIDDTQLWNSTNPLGALITIKIPADNGTVVCTGFGAQAWIFTTVKSPWDGEHPVSGNRLFGYFIDNSGDMVIYTRGVDRFTTKISNNALQYTIESFGYSEAKTMWETMQQKVSTFVNSKNGSSTILPGIDYTPNYIFVKDYIKGTKQLNQLGCH
ncbi:MULTISPECIES: hypothetical protein [Chryseobacterium]|uniref:hypothetical protein n=1 Tax=Chryseobacterium TaxID=59732 RepID=UPI00195C2163|nr:MULTISPECIES: hypothetical protein [Chryseobacterium]MBM7419854.1 hypothetical protein [Chryseobacterium sp. JUb44]MDH6209791.1 hypothetical protein [Chryseobacterium sp. BIGb0186]WSO08532.1 hypothetical protein VUJ64_11910 [Chryseobacterium scophthalmum]